MEACGPLASSHFFRVYACARGACGGANIKFVTTQFASCHARARGGARALEGVSCANVLLMHAWCDNYVDPAGSVAFYERAQCAGSKALLLFGGNADASELRTAGPSTAHAELEALKDVDMCHLLTQEPGAERLAAAAAKWVCECNARVR